MDKYNTSKHGYLLNITSTETLEIDELVPLIDDVTTERVNFVLCVISLCVIATFGTVANVINILVFVRQGLNDTVNICLLSLACSDLGALVPLIWLSICQNPLFRYSDIPFESHDILYITAGYPHVMFVRITSWLTAFITLQRCLSISLPMKVKRIITVRRTKCTVVIIFLILAVSVCPFFYAIRIARTFIPSRNKTMYGVVYIPGGYEIERISGFVLVFTQLTPFVLVGICTVILIRSLVQQSKWRKASSRGGISGSAQSMSVRDRRVVKMLTSISCIFIACFLPSMVQTLLSILLGPEYNLHGRYENTYRIVWSLLLNLAAINSTVNIFIYYTMSSKLRMAYRNLLMCWKAEEKYIKGSEFVSERNSR